MKRRFTSSRPAPLRRSSRSARPRRRSTGTRPTPVGIRVSQPGTAGKVIESCLLAAAQAQRLPPAMLVILLNVEGGRLGRVSGNANATVDIGPMQVNEIWLPDVARHWGVSVPTAFLGLRDDFCANTEAGAWILRRGLDEARGDFWTGCWLLPLPRSRS